MKLPTIHGYIERRILVNFTADPGAVQKIIPLPFRPKIYKGKAIVGICLIRLKGIKPKGFPHFLGISSENGAHRIAVEWDEDGQVKEGVYIPRRDTSSRLNSLAGGRIFPGKHFLAKFEVAEDKGNYNIAFTSSDNTSICLECKEADAFDQDSIFESLENVSEFFRKGGTGYSPNGKTFEGLKLETYTWQVRPLEVSSVRSSFFENEALFPKGSIKFDNALLMTGVEHEWKTLMAKRRTVIAKECDAC
jgi:hypothetical protein